EDVEDKLAKLAEEADAAEGDDASPLAGSPYGEGSYVGDEPPEGFVIKGNDRSMKYHLPGSAAYERTIAEVWFASEEAAEAAGFVRAQR
ncbi:MAG TPA: 50S ribosomal protein L17, partial [Propionicimonas sp.]|nr:50S ribosomal protein L17 [Propionicimonas sp.]